MSEKIVIEIIYRHLHNGELFEAIDLARHLPWGERRGLFSDLNMRILRKPQNYSEDEAREDLKHLIKTEFENVLSSKIGLSPIVLSNILLNMDFTPQKKHLSKKEKGNSVFDFILLQGTRQCGLHYFILWRHQNCQIYPVKASQVVRSDKKDEFCKLLSKFLDIKVDWENNGWDPWVAIAIGIHGRLQEKDIVLYIYDLEDWAEQCLETINWFISHILNISIKRVEHNFFCYFVHTDNPCFSDSDNLVVLPHVTEMIEDEMHQLPSNYWKYFECSKEEVDNLLSGPKKLADIIDIFAKHSVYKTDIDAYLNSNRLPF